ncbi:MAG: hypothetical protein KDK59_00360 [Simkania sp.]|nr:hypothetical protein [Simkania sp.]
MSIINLYFEERVSPHIRAIVEDFSDPSTIPQTTSRKVQNLISSITDVPAFDTRLIAIGAICAYLTRFIPLQFISLAITILALVGIYDFHRHHQNIKQLKDWVITQYPDPNTPFMIDDTVINRWNEFVEQNKQTPLFLKPFFVPYFHQVTTYLLEIKRISDQIRTQTMHNKHDR